ncbi:MAG: hypothetical protein ACI4XA_06080 [Oscillospiraceae bacterium]
MSRTACVFMALSAFLAGVIIGSRFLPCGGSVGCNTNTTTINNYGAVKKGKDND